MRLGLALRPCLPAGGVQSRPLKCCHAEFCTHRYGFSWFKVGIASGEVFVAHVWSAVLLWHSFMRFTTLFAMFSTHIAAGDT